MSCTQQDLQKFSTAAKDEIGETGVNILECVEKVKDKLVEKYPDLTFPSDINEIVERCLRSRKFNCEEAVTQVHSFFKFLFDCRKLHGEMYFVPSARKDYCFDSFGISVLKNRDSKGRIVILFRMDRMPGETYNLDMGVAAIIMVLNEITKCSVDTQRLGIVFVCDFKGYEFGHAKQYTYSRIKLVVQMVQGAIPVRFKGFHMIRCPLLFTYTYAMIRPFLKEKIKTRIHFHSHDLTQFHKYVATDILPEYLGGIIPDNGYADLDMISILCAKDNYYTELFRYGYFHGNENQNL